MLASSRSAPTHLPDAFRACRVRWLPDINKAPKHQKPEAPLSPHANSIVIGPAVINIITIIIAHVLHYPPHAHSFVLGTAVRNILLLS